MRPRFRFSPSPAGQLHIIQVRTALFNWAFSRALDGDLIVRIADSGSETQLLDDLTWLGVDWDEGPDIGGEYAPYRQVSRRQRHIEVALQLFTDGLAFYEGSPSGPETGPLHMRLPSVDGVQVEDALRGVVAYDPADVREVMLLDAGGEPTALLATVVADHDMGISHVVQDEASLATAHWHAYLYRLLDWSEPTWIHLPTICDDSGEPMTGRALRSGRYNLSNLRDLGYLPQAIFNYLLLLGWTPAKGNELVDKWDVRQQFRLADMKNVPVTFAWDKLGAINRHYLDKLSGAELLEQMLPFIEEVYGELPAAGSMLPQIVRTIRPNLNRLGDAAELAEWAFERPEGYDKLAREALRAEPAGIVLIRLIAVVARLVLLDVDSAAGLLHNLGDELAQQYGWQESQIMPAICAALTGSTDTPPPNEIMGIIGQAETLQRLAAALHWRRE